MLSNGTSVLNKRKADYDIDQIFLDRWSPRAYDDKEVPEDILYSIFEAARWAPSASNEQPWRFIIARTKADREKFYPFIMEGNRIWCEKAPVIAVIIGNKITSKGQPNGAVAFDTGAAWSYLALEAARKGLVTHAMGGIFKDKAREILEIPEEYEVFAAITIGYEGKKEDLADVLQEREQASDRRPIKETLFEGSFSNPAL
jgi:nitroreductase